MNLSSKAIVIHRMRYKDNGLIVKLYTEKAGLLSFIIPNATSKKSNLIAIYQPLTIISIESFLKENRTLHYIKEVRVVDPLHSMFSQPTKIGVAMFMSEILHKTLDEEDVNPIIFNYLIYSIHWLEASNKIANFPLAFLINLSKYYGFYPTSQKSISDKYFDLLEGEFKPSIPVSHDEYLLEKTSETLQLFLGSNFDDTSSIKILTETKKTLINQMINYFRIHLEKTRTVHSHIILEEIFNIV